jgi:hypothetical protein
MLRDDNMSSTLFLEDQTYKYYSLFKLRSYTTSVLPERLSAIRRLASDTLGPIHLISFGNNFTNECLKLVSDLPEFEEIQSVEEQRLTLLDLTMLEAAIAHSGLAIPDSIKNKTSDFAIKLGAANVLTYEKYILENPVNTAEARLFMQFGSPEREQELFFVNTHRQIELKLKSVIEDLIKIYEYVRKKTQFGISSEFILEEVEFDLSNAVEEMSIACREIGNLFRLNGESFETFRRYFKSNPERDLPGPSGLFSATFQVLDRLLLDSNEEENGSIPNEIAFPQHEEHGFVGIPTVRKAQQFTIIKSQFKEFIEGKQDLKLQIESIIANLLRFRKGHKGLVKKYVPQALEGSADGTSTGSKFYQAFNKEVSPVESLLDDRILQVQTALIKLQSNK